MKKIKSGLEAKLIKEDVSIFSIKKDNAESCVESKVEKNKCSVKKDTLKKSHIKEEIECDKSNNKKSLLKKENEKKSAMKNEDKKRNLEDSRGKKRKCTEKMKTPMSKIERKILTQGTIKDKINVLTLQVERNPSAENYKALLHYAENQRNDVIYEVLKNVKDLLINKGVCKDFYIKQKITKTFEINLRNIHIKKKVLKLVFSLLKNNIYFLELIYPFLNKLGDKKELEDFVVENAKALFPVQEEILLDNIEDFFFKNPSFKARLSLLKLLSEVSPSDKKKQTDLFLNFITINLDLPEEQRMILLKYLIGGLSSSLELHPGTLPTPVVDILKGAVCPTLSLDIFKIFYYTKSSSTKDILYRILSYPPSEELMALIFKYVLEEKDPKIIKYIFNRSLLYRKELVLAILFLVNREKMDLSNYFGLSLLSNHYSLIVRETVRDMLLGKTVREIKPFDQIDVETYEQK